MIALRRHPLGRARRGALALLLAAASLGCSSDAGDGAVKIPDTTKVLAAEALAALSAVSPDLQTLTFDGEPAALRGLRPGDVLVAGVHPPLLPSGMLRKVQGVERSAGKLVVSTGDARLTDAIERGSIKQTFALAPDSKADGDASSGGFVFGFNDIELYEGVTLNGNVSFRPTVSLDVEIDWFELEKFVFTISSDQQASLELSASREASFDEQYLVQQITLTPITIQIGPVPVVLVPVIRLLIGVDGKVGAEMTTGLTGDARVSIGFGYHDGGFEPISELSSSGQVDVPRFRDGAQASARAWAGPQVELAAYGLAGIQATLRGYVRGEIDVTADPWWRLFAGVEALAGVFERILGLEYETPVVKQERELQRAAGPSPSSSATGPVLWARSFGGANNEYPVALTTTKDGGSLFVGHSNSFGDGSAWIVKLDALGHVGWQRAIPDIGAFTAVEQLDDEGYLLAAGWQGTSTDAVRIVRLDRNGDLRWARKWTAAKELSPMRLARTADGHFLLAGGYGALSERDFWLTKLDAQGTPLWSRTYGGEAEDLASGLLVDGGDAVLAGATHSFGVSFNGQWVIKVDAQGELRWQQAIDGDGNEVAHAVVADGGGGYFVVGSTFNQGLVTHLAGDGALSWSSIYDAGTPYDELFDGIASGDGGLIAAGKSDLADKSDTWMLRLTPAGKVLWSISYGGPLEESAGGLLAYADASRALQLAPDGGLLCASTRESSPGDPTTDVWLFKTSAEGSLAFDAASGMASTNRSGAYQSYAQQRLPTSVAAQAVSLSSSDEALKPFSTTAASARQAGPP